MSRPRRDVVAPLALCVLVLAGGPTLPAAAVARDGGGGGLRPLWQQFPLDPAETGASATERAPAPAARERSRSPATRPVADARAADGGGGGAPALLSALLAVGMGGAVVLAAWRLPNPIAALRRAIRPAPAGAPAGAVAGTALGAGAGRTSRTAGGRDDAPAARGTLWTSSPAASEDAQDDDVAAGPRREDQHAGLTPDDGEERDAVSAPKDEPGLRTHAERVNALLGAGGSEDDNAAGDAADRPEPRARMEDLAAMLARAARRHEPVALIVVDDVGRAEEHGDVAVLDALVAAARKRAGDAGLLVGRAGAQTWIALQGVLPRRARQAVDDALQGREPADRLATAVAGYPRDALTATALVDACRRSLETARRASAEPQPSPDAEP
jgi:hypothetical protein